jgi:pSer/pThr/pTyr-binding forkhead associated (FHA) protein
MFTLRIVNGPLAGRVYLLDKDSMVIGRHQNAEIVLDSKEISRQHARITRREHSFFIEDLGTTNGTLINGRRLVQPAPLTDGDSIQIGSSTLVFRGEEARSSCDVIPFVSDLSEDLVLRARVPVDPDAPDFQGPAAGHKLQAVLRMGQKLAGTLDLDKLLDKLLTYLVSLFPTAERGSVVLRRGNDLVPRAQRSWDPWSPGAQPANESIVSLALREGVGVLAGPLTVTENAAGAACGTFVCAPLISQDGLRLGAIVLEARARTWRPSGSTTSRY